MARLINHVDLTVSDLARSRAFYRPVMRYLGYEVSSDAPQEIVFTQADKASVTSIALQPARGSGRGRCDEETRDGWKTYREGR